VLGAFLSPRELASSRGKLAAVQGLVEDYWSKFTDEDLKLMSGRRSRLIEKLQERYGFSHQEAEIQVRSFQGTLPQEVGNERPGL
jgi:uncharacterized protein YjbJ (UPF0337 family)